MLKVYTVWQEFSIDGGKWKRLYEGPEYCRTMTEELDELEKPIFTNLSFHECVEFLKNNIVFGMHTYTTSFRKRLVITIRLHDRELRYTEKPGKSFTRISLRYCYKATWMSLTDIMKYFRADQVIQYLKERELSVCPIIK